MLFYMVDAIRERTRFIGGAMDARGNGQWLAEVAAREYGNTVAQVMLSVEWYRENMPRFKAASLKIGRSTYGKTHIYSDIRSLRMENGVARIPDAKGRDQQGMQRHGDASRAAALAYPASVMPRASVRIRRRGRRSEAPGNTATRIPSERDAREDAMASGGAGRFSMFGRARFGRGAW